MARTLSQCYTIDVASDCFLHSLRHCTIAHRYIWCIRIDFPACFCCCCFFFSWFALVVWTLSIIDFPFSKPILDWSKLKLPIWCGNFYHYHQKNVTYTVHTHTNTITNCPPKINSRNFRKLNAHCCTLDIFSCFSILFFSHLCTFCVYVCVRE